MKVKNTPSGATTGPTLASRYDWLLLLLPVPMLLGAVVAASVGVRTAFGVSVGGLPSAAMLAYALFVDPPLSNGECGRERGATVQN